MVSKNFEHCNDDFHQNKEKLLEQLLIQIQQHNEILDTIDDQDVPYFKDIKKYAKTVRQRTVILEAREKMKIKMDNLNKKFEQLLSNLQKIVLKIDNISEQNQNLEADINKNRYIIENFENICEDLGFSYDKVETNIYEVQWTKLPIEDYQRVFSFQISFDDQGTKVLKCNPDDCIDLEKIENIMSKWDKFDERNFMRLILTIRKELINKYK